MRPPGLKPGPFGLIFSSHPEQTPSAPASMRRIALRTSRKTTHCETRSVRAGFGPVHPNSSRIARSGGFCFLLPAQPVRSPKLFEIRLLWFCHRLFPTVTKPVKHAGPRERCATVLARRGDDVWSRATIHRLREHLSKASVKEPPALEILSRSKFIKVTSAGYIVSTV